MQSKEVKKTFKKIILANLGFAMFGTPIALLFLQSLHKTTLGNSIGVVFVFFSVFIVMHIGLDLLMRNLFTNKRDHNFY